MGALRECTACYQNYVVSTESAQQQEQCPWCGASSTASPKIELASDSNALHGTMGEKQRRLNGNGAAAIAAGVRSPWRMSEADPAKQADCRTCDPAHKSAAAAPWHADAIVRPDHLRVQSVDALTGERLGFPTVEPSRFPVRRRGTPGVIWMMVGIGLGACVVLAVVATSVPGFWRKAEPTPKSPLASVAKTHHVAKQPTIRPSVTSEQQVTQSNRPTSIEVKSQLTPEEQVSLVRQVLRQELGHGGDEEQAQPSRPQATRWLADNPPPIGDPADNSPPLGLMVKDRKETISMRRVEPTAGDRAPTESPQVAAQDDKAAVAALVAAGIRCDKDSATGRVTRIDGSFRMTDALMPHVAKLPGLVYLKLSFSDVTDAGLAYIKELTSLKELILNESKVTDAGMAHLANLTELEKLDLEKTKVGDQSLSQIERLKSLKHLDIRGTGVTSGRLETLKQALPDAKIRL